MCEFFDGLKRFNGTQWILTVAVNLSDPSFSICLAQSTATRACSPLPAVWRNIRNAGMPEFLNLWDYDLLKGKQWPRKMYMSKIMAKDMFVDPRTKHDDFDFVILGDAENRRSIKVIQCIPWRCQSLQIRLAVQRWR